MDTVTMNFVVCQWIRLRLPFCSPGFESQANHYLPTPFQFVVELLWCEKNENKNKKRPGLAQFFETSSDSEDDADASKDRNVAVQNRLVRCETSFLRCPILLKLSLPCTNFTSTYKLPKELFTIQWLLCTPQAPHSERCGQRPVT